MNNNVLLTEDESNICINGLAQHMPFRFVDRVLTLSPTHIVTELQQGQLSFKFIQGDEIDTYVMLEYAAQSSGMLLRDKKEKQRGVIASFNKVERFVYTPVAFPIRLESTLMEQRHPMYTFDFKVLSNDELIVKGTTSIFIGG
jgi:hypothetical protein